MAALHRPVVTRAAEGLPRRRFAVAKVEAMAAAGVLKEGERVELIGGELVPMSPKGNQHEIVKVALLRRWYRAAPEGFDLAPETTFRLSEDTYRARRRGLLPSCRIEGPYGQ